MKHCIIILIFSILGLYSYNSYGQTVTDIDNNVYNTVAIGSQVWLKENLKTTKLNTGTAIPLVTDNTEWVNLTTAGYCWYGNLSTNGAIYGALYNWYAVNTKNLCPTGWHIPTNAEWQTLIDYLGGSSVAGNKLKEAGTSHWALNTTGTNESGFTGLPGGQRGGYGAFDLLKGSASFWSSTEENTNFAGIWNLSLYGGLVQYFSEGKAAGKSCRCIKDAPNGIQDIQEPVFNLHLYPNPSNNCVIVEYEKSKEVSLQLIDIFGKVILERQFINSTEIKLLHKGLYIIRLTDEPNIRTEKLMIQ